MFCFSKISQAATYYVSTAGFDTNSGTQAAPWKTIAKVNSSTFQPGDFILFKRGEMWREQLVPPSSGSPGNPITFSAYGTGENPIISGAVIPQASQWTNAYGVEKENMWAGIMIRNNNNHIIIKNGVIRDGAFGGIQAGYYGAGNTISNLLIENNDVYSNNTYGVTAYKTGLTAHRQVVFVSADTPPCAKDPCPIVNPGKPSRYVLELNVGMAKKTGLKIGDQIVFKLAD